MKIKFLMGLLFLVFSLGISREAFAISLVPFSDFDFSEIQFDDRIRISTDLQNSEFETSLSSDFNQDGNVDLLEEETFFTSGDSLRAYLGNKHNRFDISRSLLFVGVDGTFDSFLLNELEVKATDAVSISDASVFFADGNIGNFLDTVLLFEIDQKLEDREPNSSPIGENNPFAISMADIQSTDPSLRFYLGGYGAISSGTFNSFTPKNSDILFIPTFHREGNETAPPVPEPGTILLSSFGLAAFLLKRKGSK